MSFTAEQRYAGGMATAAKGADYYRSITRGRPRRPRWKPKQEEHHVTLIEPTARRSPMTDQSRTPRRAHTWREEDL